MAKTKPGNKKSKKEKKSSNPSKATMSSPAELLAEAAFELQKGNISVGIVVGAIFLSVGVAIGLVIGMGLN